MFVLEFKWFNTVVYQVFILYSATLKINPDPYTVNPEIFARVLFSRNFADAKFCENETLAKWGNHSVIY